MVNAQGSRMILSLLLKVVLMSSVAIAQEADLDSLDQGQALESHVEYLLREVYHPSRYGKLGPYLVHEEDYTPARMSYKKAARACRTRGLELPTILDLILEYNPQGLHFVEPERSSGIVELYLDNFVFYYDPSTYVRNLENEKWITPGWPLVGRKPMELDPQDPNLILISSSQGPKPRLSFHGRGFTRWVYSFDVKDGSIRYTPKKGHRYIAGWNGDPVYAVRCFY